MATADLSSLDAATVAAIEAQLVTQLAEQYPSLDLTEGRVLHDLLIRPAAMFHALNQTNMDTIRNSMTLSAVEGGVTPVDDTIVDAVVSNFRLVRDTGAKSTGQVTIVLSALVTTTVAYLTKFTVGTTSFITTKTFIGVTSAESVLDSTYQRLIVERNDGTYSFVIDVEAEQAGAAYTLKANTNFDAVDAEPANMVIAYATQDFTSGRDVETNAQLVARYKQSISPAVLSGRSHIEATLRAVDTGLKAVSIVGYGDAEMLRDRHNIFQISHGGKADMYIRTRDCPQAISVQKTATLVDPVTHTYQITLLRDDAPGHYSVDKVLPADTNPDEGTLTITQTMRGLDLTSTDGAFVPDVDTVIEGAYSRYQTTILQFIDPDNTDSTADYDVYVTYMPSVLAMQNRVNDRAFRNPQADYLVRAAVPALCSVELTVQYTSSTAPSATAIQQSVASVVNNMPFAIGQLPASLVHDAVCDVVGRLYAIVISPINMYCRILKPDGTVMAFANHNQLRIPSLPAEGVTPRTTAIFLAAEDVDVTLEKVNALPV